MGRIASRPRERACSSRGAQPTAVVIGKVGGQGAAGGDGLRVTLPTDGRLARAGAGGDGEQPGGLAGEDPGDRGVDLLPSSTWASSRARPGTRTRRSPPDLSSCPITHGGRRGPRTTPGFPWPLCSVLGLGRCTGRTVRIVSRRPRARRPVAAPRPGSEAPPPRSARWPGRKRRGGAGCCGGL